MSNLKYSKSKSSEPIKYTLIGCPFEFTGKTKMHDMLEKIPWITYRDGFIPIDGWCSDTGWGCMIRVAQMMLWTTLMRHIRNQMSFDCWKKYDITDLELMKIVLPLFLDDYQKQEAPFSIRNIIEVGKNLLQKGAGEWYGAHSISQVIREVNEKYNCQYYKAFKILTFNEGVIYKQKINELFEGPDSSTGVLWLVPLRLGLKKIDSQYHAQIKSALGNKLSVGILSGKNIYALYWVGYYDKKLITLDPHTEQDAVTELNDDTFWSFSTRHPKTINFVDWDTTMAFWFYLKDTEDAEHLYSSIESWKADKPEEYLIGLEDIKKDVQFDTEKEAEFDEDFEII